jgi:hypothetical protein
VNIEAREVFQRMSQDELENLILHLGRYALKVCCKYRWRSGNPMELPKGETSDSIVSKAIKMVLDGSERRWDPKKHPDVTKYLMDTLDSLINHLANCSENKLVKYESDCVGNDEKHWHTGGPERGPTTDWLVRQETPESILLRKEDQALEDLALSMLVDSCKNDPVLLRVIESMQKGQDKPAEISHSTGIQVEEIYNAIKRLDRKAALVRRRMQSKAIDGRGETAKRLGRRSSS